MTEKRKAMLRMVAIALLVLNVLFFVYGQFAGEDRAVARRIEQLQINPERIKIVAAATRGPGSAPADPSAFRACLQWGPLAGTAVGRAEAALAELSLSQAPLQRRLQNERFAFLLREPDSATIARVAELQRAYPGTELRAVPCPL